MESALFSDKIVNYLIVNGPATIQQIKTSLPLSVAGLDKLLKDLIKAKRIFLCNKKYVAIRLPKSLIDGQAEYTKDVATQFYLTELMLQDKFVTAAEIADKYKLPAWSVSRKLTALRKKSIVWINDNHSPILFNYRPVILSSNVDAIMSPTTSFLVLRDCERIMSKADGRTAHFISGCRRYWDKQFCLSFEQKKSLCKIWNENLRLIVAMRRIEA